MPPDRIYIRDLAFRCIIGISPEERREKQDVVFSLTLFCDHSKAAASDRIEDAVDYKSIKKEIRTFVESSSFQLLESLANGVASICLAHPDVARVTVCVDKPGALRFARSVAVEITRSRDS